MIDVERARRETPGCEERIHLNNAGAALQPAPVLEAVLGHLELETQLGGYEAEDAAAEALDARLRLGGGACRRAPRGDRASSRTPPARGTWPSTRSRSARADRILTSEAEYASNYIAFLQVAHRTGAVVEPIEGDETGTLSVGALARRWTSACG